MASRDGARVDGDDEAKKRMSARRRSTTTRRDERGGGGAGGGMEDGGARGTGAKALTQHPLRCTAPHLPSVLGFGSHAVTTVFDGRFDDIAAMHDPPHACSLERGDRDECTRTKSSPVSTPFAPTPWLFDGSAVAASGWRSTVSAAAESILSLPRTTRRRLLLVTRPARREEAETMV